MKQAVGTFELIHGLDDAALAAEIDRRAAARGIVQPVLVQVNLAGEATKSGVAPDDLDTLIAAAREVRGLSAMPPLSADAEASRPYFRRLRELAEEHGLRQLSMGRSQDYRVAAEEGATFVRVGSVLWQR